jgi:CubicO group peptidase (beta-lactamase class C family)
VTPSTLFYAGSTTKAFTTAIMTFLVDDNLKYPQVQWDTPIHQLLPDDFVLKNEYATTHITIEDVLSHRSGLPGHDCSLGSAGSGVTVQSIVRSLRYLPLTAEPRTTYQYCNIMYIVASHVIETLTKKKLGDLIKEWIWKPLGMNSSCFDLDSAKTAVEDLAHGYNFRYHTNDGGYKDLGWLELDGVAGAGSVISNVLDYAKWARAIMNKSTPLSKSGFESWLRPRTIMPSDPPFTGPRLYALGWRTGVYRGHQFYTHSGGMKGYGAELLIFPGIEFAVTAMANTSGTSNFLGQRLTWHLVDEKLNVALEERFDWNKR